MKEICSNFKIIPIDDVRYIHRNTIDLYEGKEYDELFTDILNISATPQKSDAGIVWSVSQDIVIDKVTENIAVKYSVRRAVALIVGYTDGTHTIYGTPDYPVMVILAHDIQKDTLSVELKTTYKPII